MKVIYTSKMENEIAKGISLGFQKLLFGLIRSTIGSKSDCRSSCREIDPNPVPYFRGDYS